MAQCYSSRPHTPSTFSQAAFPNSTHIFQSKSKKDPMRGMEKQPRGLEVYELGSRIGRYISPCSLSFSLFPVFSAVLLNIISQGVKEARSFFLICWGKTSSPPLSHTYELLLMSPQISIEKVKAKTEGQKESRQITQ